MHAGAAPDPATGARALPIYQTTAYVFEDADHAAALFNLQTVGFIYFAADQPDQRRAGSPARHAGRRPRLHRRLVGPCRAGAGAVPADGARRRDRRLLAPLWRLAAADAQHLSEVRLGGEDRRRRRSGEFQARRHANTKAFFIESLANPGGVISDIEAIARIAEAAGVPLLVDNTLATPWLCKPIDYGATLIVHSTTKFLSGTGTSMGGAVVDSGKFDWAKSGKFPSLAGPEPAYHGLNFFESFGDMAYTFHSHAVGLRDLGPSQAPFNAWLTMLGIETLGLRMERHCANAQKVAEYLAKHPAVAWVNYAGLPDNKYHQLARKYLPKGAGSIFTFGVKGGYDVGIKVVDSVELFSHLANIGDAKSLIIHPASTTHRQLSDEQRVAAGAGPDVLRLSIRDRNGGRHHRRSGASSGKGDGPIASEAMGEPMLSKADNEFLTPQRQGHADGRPAAPLLDAGAPGEELPERDGPPKKIQILGEDLLAFRSDRRSRSASSSRTAASRRQSLLRPQRRVRHPLRLPRLEVRCRRQLHRPRRPRRRSRPTRTRSSCFAYPTREWADMIWVYMGPREKMPELPQLETGPGAGARAATSPRNGRTATGCRVSRARSIPPTSPSCMPCCAKDEATRAPPWPRRRSPTRPTPDDRIRWIHNDPRPKFTVLGHDAGLLIGARAQDRQRPTSTGASRSS